MKDLPKKIMVPIDGSENSLRALDYLELMYSQDRNVEVLLFYALPALPPILTEDYAMSQVYWDWDGLRSFLSEALQEKLFSTQSVLRFGLSGRMLMLKATAVYSCDLTASC